MSHCVISSLHEAETALSTYGLPMIVGPFVSTIRRDSITLIRSELAFWVYVTRLLDQRIPVAIGSGWVDIEHGSTRLASEIKGHATHRDKVTAMINFNIEGAFDDPRKF